MTTQATHTPGPWREKRKLAIYSADEEPICTVFPAETERQSAADARLIAAAPDLLNACKELVEHLDSLPDDTEKCRHLKTALNNRAGDLMLAAIAKAEGRAE